LHLFQDDTDQTVKALADRGYDIVAISKFTGIAKGKVREILGRVQPKKPKAPSKARAKAYFK
jgi:hypothetical protein